MTSIFVSIDTGGTRTNVEVAVPGSDWQSRRFEVTASLSGVLPKPGFTDADSRLVFSRVQ